MKLPLSHIISPRHRRAVGAQRRRNRNRRKEWGSLRNYKRFGPSHAPKPHYPYS